MSNLSDFTNKGSGWNDLVAPFQNANAGGTTPASWVAMGANGHYGMKFDAGDSLFVTFHVLHDWKVGTTAYPHVHFLCTSTMTASQTVVWTLEYTIAKGHAQAQSLTGTRSSITLTYTADGTEVVGEHLVVEDATGFSLVETDSLIHMECTLTSKQPTGDIFGLQCDLHYESDGSLTNEKAPAFTKNT